jgi:NAD(P)-dependent dehydrogenase (short-subunit alcohol dehydrogenase family)
MHVEPFLEMSDKGIRVNAVAPGATMTPLSQDAYTPELKAAYESRIALGRVAEPADIARGVLFLASDAAGYVAGHQLVVDGGMILNGNVSPAVDRTHGSGEPTPLPPAFAQWVDR